MRRGEGCPCDIPDLFPLSSNLPQSAAPGRQLPSTRRCESPQAPEPDYLATLKGTDDKRVIRK